METHVVYKMAMDDDNVLYVGKNDEMVFTKSHVIVARGTEKECRKFVIENQHKRATPSLLKRP